MTSRKECSDSLPQGVRLIHETRAAVSVYTDTHAHTNTLPYTSLAHAHRGITMTEAFDIWLNHSTSNTQTHYRIPRLRMRTEA